MYQLFLTPEWFNGWDLVFDSISLIIALLIAGYSWKIHQMSSENKYAYFSLAFVLISLGFALKLFTYGILYFGNIREAVAGVLRPIAGQGLEYADLFYRAGFFLQMVFMLGGWLLIFFVSQKSRERLNKFYEVSQIVLFIYLILLISVISNFKYAIFYLTSMVILGMVVLNYYKNYLNTENSNAYLVMNSFLLILISQFCFVFVFLWENLYIFGEVFLLIGFLTLLYTYRRVTKLK
ncbi:MAG: hypothetical protein ABIA37_04285 [Candidatus Woesearchaeota archaeon]